MGNKGRQSSSSSQQSNSFSSSKSVSNTDSRSYQNIDDRSYQTTDSRQFSNTDSRNMSTNINQVDNRSISEIALDCGINPKDVENYTNDESININQDNSQNIVVSGDGNTMKNITQKMNLTSYGPKIQKCMQDAVSKIESANVTDLDSENSNKTSSSNKGSNSTTNLSENAAKSTSKNDTSQKSDTTQTSKQGSTQSNSASQTAGMGSFSLDVDHSGLFIIIGVIALFAILGFTMSNIMKNKMQE